MTPPACLATGSWEACSREEQRQLEKLMLAARKIFTESEEEARQ